VSAVTIYTAGHSNRTAEAFVELLQEAGIETIVDVRRIPHSGRWPQFRRGALESTLAAHGIRYVWEGDALGGQLPWSEAAARHPAIADRSFAAYAAHMEGEDSRAAVERVRALARDARVALLCAEREPTHCHRSFISDYLCAFGDEVVHLVRPGERIVHSLRAEARIEGARLIYDAGRQRELGLDPRPRP
jgi:uncharacterized protein (DUF488 family)